MMTLREALNKAERDAFNPRYFPSTSIAEEYSGARLRDEVAIRALQGLISGHPDYTVAWVVDQSFRIADEFLLQRAAQGKANETRSK